MNGSTETETYVVSHAMLRKLSARPPLMKYVSKYRRDGAVCFNEYYSAKDIRVLHYQTAIKSLQRKFRYQLGYMSCYAPFRQQGRG